MIIRNMVFDMGNVLGSYNPMAVLEKYAENEADQALLFNTIFGSEEWLIRDAGDLSRDEARAIWLARLPEHLHKTADIVLKSWHAFTPKFDDMTALVKQLHENGYSIYLLSNTSDDYEIFKGNIPAIRYMQGAVVSYEHHVLKPDLRIYRILFERYGLKPEECYFVDDSPANVAAARALGMAAYCYQRDTEELIADMQKKGIRI